MSVISILNSCEVQKGKVVISCHWSFVIKQNESATLSVFLLAIFDDDGTNDGGIEGYIYSVDV